MAFQNVLLKLYISTTLWLKIIIVIIVVQLKIPSFGGS